ncbi:hypothetical protein BJ878DRAFT_573949 [Calycina marina]|uniref:Uncharacterized protein n=1 Tax=Calycina marina TaxID=1763456 RepID=A0A9P8CH91_9HELO|nr:hypothetical protein BJ878DRAFT_573949 [Calycina marina]
MQTNDNCSLNGVCRVSSFLCDLGWTLMAVNDSIFLLPRKEQAIITQMSDSYQVTKVPQLLFSILKSCFHGGNSIRGGNYLQDRSNPQLCHLVVAQFSNAWRPFSTVVLAEFTTGYAGPYVYKKEFFGTFHHNPRTIWNGADQRCIIYFIGVGYTHSNSCSSVKFDNKVYVSNPGHLAGLWSKLQMLLSRTNPDPLPLLRRGATISQIVLGLKDNNFFTEKPTHPLTKRTKCNPIARSIPRHTARRDMLIFTNLDGALDV